jgi:hypothetical protein
MLFEPKELGMQHHKTKDLTTIEGKKTMKY